MSKKYLFTILLILTFDFAHAQSVSINASGATPHPSAMLDISNANKGLLIPRVALTGSNDVATIPSPATSLLVYNTASTTGSNAVGAGYYYWNGNVWLQLVALPGLQTSTWSLTGNASIADNTNFIGTITDAPFNVRVNNQKAGRIDSANRNTFWGYRAGSDAAAFYNTAIGFKALFSNTTGDYNSATGVNALYSNTTGSFNTANGWEALALNTDGTYNTANGALALENNTTGIDNSAFGQLALNQNTTGRENTAFGNNALFDNTTGNYNTATGKESLTSSKTGNSNTANGYYALHENQVGFSNVAIGTHALLKNISSSNLVAVGDSSLYNNLSPYNTGMGSKSLYSNTTGTYNTANGANALYLNKTGSSNVAVGAMALFKNLTSSNLVAVGESALYSNTGVDNTAVGSKALYFNTTGTNNTAFGVDALYTNVNGSNNTAIGYNANVSTLSLSNATAIGANAIVNANNKIRLGDNNVTVIEGQVAYSFPSDARFKYNIKSNVPGLDFIRKLTPVTYYLDDQKLDEYTRMGAIDTHMVTPISYSKEKQLHTGFLAQDVEKIATELGYSFDGVHAPADDRDHYSLAYSQFIMPLVKSVQEQQQMIENQNKKINSQQQKIKLLTNEKDKLMVQQKQIETFERENAQIKAEIRALAATLKGLINK